jgi:hypothetical protein
MVGADKSTVRDILTYWYVTSPAKRKRPDRAASGCRFHPRCRYATDICETDEPPLTRHGSLGHLAACHHPLNLGDQVDLAIPAGVVAAAEAEHAPGASA